MQGVSCHAAPEHTEPERARAHDVRALQEEYAGGSHAAAGQAGQSQIYSCIF